MADSLLSFPFGFVDGKKEIRWLRTLNKSREIPSWIERMTKAGIYNADPERSCEEDVGEQKSRKTKEKRQHKPKKKERKIPTEKHYFRLVYPSLALR